MRKAVSSMTNQQEGEEKTLRDPQRTLENSKCDCWQGHIFRRWKLDIPQELEVLF